MGMLTVLTAPSFSKASQTFLMGVENVPGFGEVVLQSSSRVAMPIDTSAALGLLTFSTSV